MARGKWFVRGFGIVMASAVVLVCAAETTMAIGLHFAFRPADVEGEAGSAEVKAARAATIAAQNKTFAALLGDAPVLAESVEDRCDSDMGMIGTKAYVSCYREVVRYLARDDDRLKAARDESVRTEWTERPTVPAVYRDFERGIATPQYDGQVIFEDKPIDKAGLYRTAYAKHRYVVALTLHTQYHPPRPG